VSTFPVPLKWNYRGLQSTNGNDQTNLHKLLLNAISYSLCFTTSDETNNIVGDAIEILPVF
jgi:hypothetical protein